MKNRGSKVIAILLFANLVVATAANAAADLLGSTRITFSASGSPNTIAGSWLTNGIEITSFSNIQYYTVTVLSFDSPFGQAIGLVFTNDFPGSQTGLSLGSSCPAGISCIGTPEVGSVSIVDVELTQQPQARDFLARLGINSPLHRTSGPALVSFSSGGAPTIANGELLVSAYGQMQAVPEMNSFTLNTTGIIALWALAAYKRRKI